MTSALMSRNESSRFWWPLSSKPQPSVDAKPPQPVAEKSPARDVASKPSTGLKFNNLASVMRFKSKKHPSLTIQEPPSPIRTVNVTQTDGQIRQITYTNRPPSKSVSSTRSPVESLGPKTPTDHPQYHSRQSLFTLSDTDPFASPAISISQTSNSNCLSVYSSVSAPEELHKRSDCPTPNRISYASAANTGDMPPPQPAIETSPKPKLSTRHSHGNLRPKLPLLSQEDTLSAAWEHLTQSTNISKKDSSTQVDSNRHSQPPPSPLPRPPMRARGMTDTGSRQPPLNFQRKPPSPSTRESSRRTPPTSPPPQVILRKASSTRVGGPPSAPPQHGLPLPPTPKSRKREAIPDDDSDILPDIGTDSTSSSSLSFASSASSVKDVTIEQPTIWDKRGKRSSPKGSPMDKSPTTLPMSQSPQHALKKAASHQSLLLRRLPSVGSMSSSIASETATERVPRKQRSYPRIPVPPLPQSLRHATSFTPLNTAASPVSPQRTCSVGGLVPGRKRLFSGSSLCRPSTSQCTPDDDARSVFSLPAEQERMQGLNFSATFTASRHASIEAPSWEEPPLNDPSGSPPMSVIDYTPQRIMSHADMLKVEASVQESDLSYVRSRGLSFTSISTLMSDKSDLTSAPPMSPASSVRLLQDLSLHNTSPSRSISVLDKGSSIAPRPTLRPSTSQATITPPTSPSSPVNRNPSQSFFPACPQPHTTSLPPPPRPRPPRPTTSPHTLQSNSQPQVLAHVTSLSPPPIRKTNLFAKGSGGKLRQRQSLMRKPSFLEIEDEVELSAEAATPHAGNMKGSFLDLARESFDTVRTFDE